MSIFKFSISVGAEDKMSEPFSFPFEFPVISEFIAELLGSLSSPVGKQPVRLHISRNDTAVFIDFFIFSPFVFIRRRYWHIDILALMYLMSAANAVVRKVSVIAGTIAVDTSFS